MQRKSRIPWIYIVPALIIVSVAVGVIYLNSTRTGVSADQIIVPTRTPPSLSGVPTFCDIPAPGACAYHWHVHLDIFVNGTKSVLVPADLGHVNDTLYALHTHDASGIIHIETPKNTIFTLGQLCEVWGYPELNSTNCLTFHNLPVSVYVNGSQWTQAQISQIPLHQHDEIAIVIGSPAPAIIPSSYQFPFGL